MTEDRSRNRERSRTNSAQPVSSAKRSGGDGASTTGANGRSVGSPGLSRWMKSLAIAAVVLAVAAGAYFSMVGKGDNISEQDKQQRIANYQALLAGPGFPLRLVGAQELDQAFASMPDSVPKEEREKMRQDVNQGKLQLAWVTVWDTAVEDGDVVRFESAASIPVDVMALNKKTTLAIPYPANGQITVTGVRDGGGGITIAVESGQTSIDWPSMAPGDQLKLPVTPSF